QTLGYFGRYRNALCGTGGVVEDDRLRSGPFGVIEQQGRAVFAYHRGAESLVTRQLDDGVLVEEVATKVHIEFTQNCVILDEWRRAIAGSRHRISNIECVREYAGIADLMAGGDGRCVGHGEGWKY